MCQEVSCKWLKHAGVYSITAGICRYVNVLCSKDKMFMYKVNTSTVQWVLCLLLARPMMGPMLPVVAVVKQAQVQVQVYVHDVCVHVCVCVVN